MVVSIKGGEGGEKREMKRGRETGTQTRAQKADLDKD